METELTTFDVRNCADDLREHAVDEFLKKTTLVDTFIRGWMGENIGRSGTTRAEFEQAVRIYLGDSQWTPRQKRPSAGRPVEFSSVLG